MLIELENISYMYDIKSNKYALKNVCLTINKNEFIGIVGSTGSGKSTLAEHLCGLLKATEGSLYYNKENIYSKKYDLQNFHKEVGIVFQFPECQFFSYDVISEASFALINAGIPKDEAIKQAEYALDLLDFPKEKYSQSPFNLSGGEQRRLAIASILAMKPKVLILDEPTVGLNPMAQKKLLKQIYKIHKEQETTVVLISHDIDKIVQYVNRIIVLDNASILYDASSKELFSQYEKFNIKHLSKPKVSELVDKLNKRGFSLPSDIITTDEFIEQIEKALGKPK